MRLEDLQASLTERYRPVRSLGGGNGTVQYLATEVATDRPVVITTPVPELGELLDPDRLFDGLELARGLDGPGLIRIEACGLLDGTAYYVTPHVPGYTVRDKLDAHGPAPLGEVARILRGVGEAFAWLHERSTSHRALCPDRVVISGDDVLLADAGVQAAIDEAWLGAPTHAGLALPEYVAPGRAGDGPGSEVDVYQMGVLAHELLTGRPPSSLALRGAAASDRTLDLLSARRPETPVELLTVVARSLSEDADARPAGMQPLLTALKATETRVTRADSVEPDLQRIGAYRLLELLGKGGMGVVYRAEQTEPVRREVALKLLKLGMDTRELLARFELERQALALMNHPNIAKVLDAGATATGRPYIVMELVSGRRLTEYCDDRALSVRQRVDLFLQVCRAVQHAHQKGVIHRDLKPSNVLVPEHLGVPTPTVIDFGLAKATREPLADPSLRTAMGQVLGTPAYMSPEQREGGGAGVDIRTDVYSLGAVLFELLTGALPIDASVAPSVSESTHGASGGGLSRPSVAFEGSATRESAAARRGTRPSSLCRELVGDLDWITLKALEPDLSRRYQTANALVRDLERYLADEPVEARGPSAAYRLSKFVRRHRAFVTAAAAITVALIAGVATTTTLWLRATRAEARAEADALAAERVSDFLTELFEVSNPDLPGADDVSARELLDRGAAEIETEMGDQPAVRARLSHTMGTAYGGLGLYEDGIELLRSAAQTWEGIRGPEDPTTLSSMHRLSAQLLSVGRVDEADSVASLALERWRPRTEAGGPVRARALTSLGNVRREQGRYVEAESLLVAAIAATPTTDSLDRATTGLHLGVVLRDLGRYGEAVEAMRASVEILDSTAGTDSPSALKARSHLATMFAEMGRSQEAERLFGENIASLEQIYGPDHIVVGEALHNLAISYINLPEGDTLGRGEPLLKRAIDIYGAALGSEHPLVVSSESNLSISYAQQGRWADAEPLMLSALDRQLRLLGEDDFDVAVSLLNLAQLYNELDDLDQGIRYAERGRAIFGRLGLSEHLANAALLRGLAQMYHAAGRAADGLEHVLRAEEIHRSTLGAGALDRLNDLEVHEVILRELGRLAEADSVRDLRLELTEAAVTVGR